MREFVAEQYLAAPHSDVAAGRAAAARRAAEQLTSEGTPVQFVRSIFIPEDETCLHLYRAESMEAVCTLAARASLTLERIAEAVSDSGAPPSAECDAAPTPVE
jgi:hypothetical protein